MTDTVPVATTGIVRDSGSVITTANMAPPPPEPPGCWAIRRRSSGELIGPFPTQRAAEGAWPGVYGDPRDKDVIHVEPDSPEARVLAEQEAAARERADSDAALAAEEARRLNETHERQRAEAEAQAEAAAEKAAEEQRLSLWVRTWLREFDRGRERLRPPPARPDELLAVVGEHEQRLKAVFDAAFSEWREGPQYKELARVRQLHSNAEEALAQAEADQEAAHEKSEKALANGAGVKGAASALSAAVAAEGKAGVYRAMLARLTEMLRKAEQEARADLQQRLTAAALAENKAAAQRTDALLAEVSEALAQRLPRLLVEREIRQACLSDAVRARFADELAALD